MKAVVLESFGDSEKAFKIKEVPQPSEILADEVLIKVESFGLNFADVMASGGPDASGHITIYLANRDGLRV